MGIYYENQQIGDIRPLQVNGQESIGGSQLRFVMAWTLFPKRADVVHSVFGTSIWVSVMPEGASNPILLGQAMPETVWCDESREGQAYDRQVMYRLSLPSPQLLALEQMRQGKGLTFMLDVRGNGQGPWGLRTFNQSVALQVNVSDWIRVLKEANAADVLLVGVHLTTDMSAPGARAAMELVRRANEHLVQGHYSAAVAECRRALESLWKSARLTEPARAARKLMSTQEERISMTKRDRELALGEALINFSHAAHHVGPNAEPEMFGRLDAALAVASTAALASSLLASPDLLRHDTAAKAVQRPAIPKAAADLTLGEKVAKVRQHFRSQPAHRAQTPPKLRNVLQSIFSKQLSQQQLEELLEELFRLGAVTSKDGKLSYENESA